MLETVLTRTSESSKVPDGGRSASQGWPAGVSSDPYGDSLFGAGDSLLMLSRPSHTAAAETPAVNDDGGFVVVAVCVMPPRGRVIRPGVALTVVRAYSRRVWRTFVAIRCAGAVQQPDELARTGQRVQPARPEPLSQHPRRRRVETKQHWRRRIW